jgi:hypothetical protein
MAPVDVGLVNGWANLISIRSGLCGDPRVDLTKG